MSTELSLSSTKVSLIKTKTEEGDSYNSYHLKFEDLSGEYPDRLILVARLQRSGGGISLDKWVINQTKEGVFLSAYLIISILGHDLDQWVHYDLASGEKVEEQNVKHNLDIRAGKTFRAKNRKANQKGT